MNTVGHRDDPASIGVELGSVPRRVGEEVVQDLELPVGQHALAGVRGDRPAETGSVR